MRSGKPFALFKAQEEGGPLSVMALSFKNTQVVESPAVTGVNAHQGSHCAAEAFQELSTLSMCKAPRVSPSNSHAPAFDLMHHRYYFYGNSDRLSLS